MDPLDRLVPYYRAFQRLPFIARRMIYVAFFMACFVIGVKTGKYSVELGSSFLIAAWFGIVWSTGLWRLWKPLLIILAIVLRTQF
ncbi:hypothetical protein [Paraburkholderia sp. BL10I2N1]|uniref:hypothetical protein n=1 Tax=Paraburkholderia sp. BL10I2N1 TaxID=1938796 RepID=UPI001060445F|nr:hypothetical protein [Paraburkholderia sp. BL10I2N1]TDN59075.1 hypothetical protein B0G77_8264 [Paraburkholderia sp. BL10I2N1]